MIFHYFPTSYSSNSIFGGMLKMFRPHKCHQRIVKHLKVQHLKDPEGKGRIKAIYEMRDGIAHPGDWKDAPKDSKDPMLVPKGFPMFMLLIPSLLNLLKLQVSIPRHSKRLGRWRRCAHRRLQRVGCHRGVEETHQKSTASLLFHGVVLELNMGLEIVKWLSRNVPSSLS